MFESEVPGEHIDEALAQLIKKYEQDEFSFSLEKIAGGYQFLTKPAYQTSIAILLKQQSQKRLSTAQLETLSIIAYKQPVTKGEIEQIRGVNSDYSVQKTFGKRTDRNQREVRANRPSYDLWNFAEVYGVFRDQFHSGPSSTQGFFPTR